MKKIIVFLFFISLPFSPFAQLEIVFNEVWESELFKKNSDEYFCFHYRPNIEAPGYISTFNGDIDNYDYQNGNLYGIINGAFITQDSLPIALMTFGVTSLIEGLVVYDENWEAEIYNISGIGGYLTYGIELDNGTLALGGDYNLYGVNSDYEKIWEVSLGGEIKGLYACENDTIVAFTENGTLTLADSGEIIQTYPNLIFERTVKTANGYWAGQKEDSLIMLSPDFIVENQIQTTDEQIYDMEYGHDRIVLLTNEKNIYIYNDELALVDSFMLQDNDLNFFSNIELDESDILVAGSSTRGTFIKKFGWDGSNLYAENNDIGITSFNLGEGVVEPYEFIWQGANEDTLIRLTYPEASFTVKNYGETTIKSLTVNSSFPTVTVGGFSYWYHFNRIIRDSVDGINIEPGDEKSISVPNLEYFLYNNPNGEFYDRCFWTSRPNGRVDDNPDNDADCSGFFVHSEEKVFLNEIEISPNPASSEIYLTINSKIPAENTWTMFDQTGRTIFSQNIPPINGQHKIQLSSIKDGLYFWKIENEKSQTAIRKIIIQH